MRLPQAVVLYEDSTTERVWGVASEMGFVAPYTVAKSKITARVVSYAHDHSTVGKFKKQLLHEPTEQQAKKKRNTFSVRRFHAVPSFVADRRAWELQGHWDPVAVDVQDDAAGSQDGS